LARCFAWRVGPDHADLQQGRRFFFAAIPAGHPVAGGDQAGNNGLAHVAEAQKANFH
jgi:hypothetical protein